MSPRTSDERQKALVLGEAPSKSGDRYHMFPLSGRVAETLCRMSGVPPEAEGSRYGRWTWALYDHYECDNLFERYQGAQSNGAAFPMAAAKELAKAKSSELWGRVVVMLGVRLPRAFGVEDASFFEWRTELDAGEERALQWVMIPHPSGLNRILNDPTARERCGSVLREARARAARL